MKKYKLKLDYTAEELKELKELGKVCDSPMVAVWLLVQMEADDYRFRNLWEKYRILDNHKDFDFMADVNNVVMGTAIFPEEEYVVHDKVTDQYVCFNTLAELFCWSQVRVPYKNTKKWWLAINPAYEPMLEKAED